MNLFILDKDEQLIDVLSGDVEKSAKHFFNARVTKEINKGRQLTFEVDMTEEGVADTIKEEHYVIFEDGEHFRLVIIKEIVDIHGEDFIKEVYCEDSYIELYDEIILEEFNSEQSIELDDAMKHVLKNTRWTSGEVDNVNRIRLTDTYATKTVLNGLTMLASAYNVEIDFSVRFVHNRIVGRYITMKRQLGRDLGKRIEYRKDMERLKRTTSTADIKTAVIPFGKRDESTGQHLTIRDVIWTADKNGLDKPAGQIYLEDTNATNQWGYLGNTGVKRPRWIAIEYPDVDDANELIKYANLQLASHKVPKVTYEVEAVDLYKLLDDEEYSFETVEIGDAVAIIDHEFTPPLTLKSRIVKIEEIYSKTNTARKITLGTVIPSIVDKDIKTQVAELGSVVGNVNVDLSAIQKQIDRLNDKTGTGVWDVVEPINQLLFASASGYHYMSKDDGIWVYDRPADQNPTKAIVLKGGQLGIARWDEQTQSWKVGTFIDGTSVNASMINTGTLNADVIQAGSITAEKLEVSVSEKIANSTTGEQVSAMLQVNAEQIKTEVAKTYETKQGVIDRINDIQIGGRNLIIRHDELVDKMVGMDGTVGSFSGSSLMKDFISVNEGETLLFSQTYVTGGDNYFRYAFYKADKLTVVTRTPNNAEKFKVIVPSEAKWLRVSYDTNNQVKLERGTKFTGWSPAPEDIEQSINNVSGELNVFQDTVNTTFKDGIINQAEALAIKQHLQTIDTAKSELDKEYTAIINNKLLSSTYRDGLTKAKSDFDNAHTSLKSFINKTISDGVITDAERNSVDSAFNTYNTYLGVYREKIQSCIDFISTAKVENIEIGGVNYIRDHKFERGGVWVAYGNEAKLDYNNHYAHLSTSTQNPFVYQSLPLGEFKNGMTFTLQYEIKVDNFVENTGSSSALIRSQLTGYDENDSYVGDVLIFGRHENEVDKYREWTKVWYTGTINSTHLDTTKDLRIRLYARNFVGNVYFRNVKLERGNKPTDLSYALDEAITSDYLNEQLQGLIEQSNDLVIKYENMVSDKVVTPSEKMQLKAEYEQIKSKYENAKLLIDAIDNPTLKSHYNDLTVIFNEVSALLEPLFVDMTIVEELNEAEIYLKIASFHSQYETVLRLVQTILNSTVTTIKTEVTEMATGVQTAITKSEEALGVTRTVGKHFDFTDEGWVRIYASLNGVRGAFMTQITDSRLSFYDGETEVAYISNKDLYISDARIINTLTVGNVALEKSAKGGMIFKWKG